MPTSPTTNTGIGLSLKLDILPACFLQLTFLSRPAVQIGFAVCKIREGGIDNFPGKTE